MTQGDIADPPQSDIPDDRSERLFIGFSRLMLLAFAFWYWIFAIQSLFEYKFPSPSPLLQDKPVLSPALWALATSVVAVALYGKVSNGQGRARMPAAGLGWLLGISLLFYSPSLIGSGPLPALHEFSAADKSFSCSFLGLPEETLEKGSYRVDGRVDRMSWMSVGWVNSDKPMETDKERLEGARRQVELLLPQYYKLGAKWLSYPAGKRPYYSELPVKELKGQGLPGLELAACCSDSLCVFQVFASRDRIYCLSFQQHQRMASMNGIHDSFLTEARGRLASVKLNNGPDNRK